MSAQEPKGRVVTTVEVEVTDTKPEIKVSGVYYPFGALALILALVTVALSPTHDRVDAVLVAQIGFAGAYILGRIRVSLGFTASVLLVAPQIAGLIAILMVVLYSGSNLDLSATYVALQLCVALQVITYVGGYLLIRRYNARRVTSTSTSKTL